MLNGLVSILTPCFNAGKLIHRLLDSVLEQDYPLVEMFVIDDGSTDNSAEIVRSYIPKFQQRGYTLKYIYQENGGQSSAINNGLKYVTGEYLVWPDSDDYFNQTNALSLFVSTLEDSGNDYGVVRCIPRYIDEHSLTEIDRLNMNPAFLDEQQFENCLYSKDFFWGAGDYMLKMSIFDRINPSRTIYVEKNAGQNWQMLLPILYISKCRTLSDTLFNVLVRASSHSRGQYKTYEEQVAKFDSYRNTILNTLNRISAMPSEERDSYKRAIINKYKLNQYELAITFNKKNDVTQLKQELVLDGIFISKKRELVLKLERNFLGRILLRIASKLRR